MPPSPEHLALIFPQEVRRREHGVGRRADMAYWGEWSDDGSVQPIREPSTAAMTLAYQLSGNPEFAMRAFQNASRRLKIARRVLRGGREHADMGGAVCSVVAGHGRNWGHGAVTSCYGPLVLGTREIQSAVVATLEVRTGDGEHCLPQNLLSLTRPPVEGYGDVIFYNGGNSTLSFSWRPKVKTDTDSDWRDLRIESGKIERVSLSQI